MELGLFYYLEIKIQMKKEFEEIKKSKYFKYIIAFGIIKKVILLILLFVPLALGCSTFKSGLTIPANKTFILGESNSKNYSAELVNTSDYEVKIRGEKKQNGEYTQGFGLAPKGKVTVYVSSDEIIKFINNNNLPVKVNVKMSKEVYGMRYIKN